MAFTGGLLGTALPLALPPSWTSPGGNVVLTRLWTPRSKLTGSKGYGGCTRTWTPVPAVLPSAPLGFSSYIPHCTWPHVPWSLERVRCVLRGMRESSSPGVRAIPLSVWKSLPDLFLSRISTLLNLVEAEGVWPTELLQAYVAMIPKASGGTRPQDQRPITVLDVVYRLWAKGITECWAPVLQGSYLGPTVMGFRAQASPLHLAQLLTDVIELQRRRGSPLWLVKFDVAKCFPSLPWWALFCVIQETGVSETSITRSGTTSAMVRWMAPVGTWPMDYPKDARPARI